MDNPIPGRLRALRAEIAQHAAVAIGALRLAAARLVAIGDPLAGTRRRPRRPDPTAEGRQGPPDTATHRPPGPSWGCGSTGGIAGDRGA